MDISLPISISPARTHPQVTESATPQLAGNVTLHDIPSPTQMDDIQNESMIREAEGHGASNFIQLSSIKSPQSQAAVRNSYFLDDDDDDVDLVRPLQLDEVAHSPAKDTREFSL